MITNEVNSTAMNIFDISGYSQNMLIMILVIIIVFAVLMFSWIRSMLLRRFHASDAKEVKEKTKEQETHDVIKELKEALVKEMRGSSFQNWIMIILTVIFISVSVFGGRIFIVIIEKAGNFETSIFGSVVDFFKSLFVK